MQDIDLKSEAIEQAALISLHKHCPDETREVLGLELVEVEDAVVAMARHDPSVLINRSLGLGTHTPVSVESLQAVVAAYQKHNIDNYFIHLYDDTLTNEARDFLADVSLNQSIQKKRGWMKFALSNPQQRSAPTDLRIEKAGPDNSIHFGRIVAAAFGMSDESAPMLAGLVHDDCWHLYVSYEGDEPAGAGAIFIDGDYAWLEWGATDPKFRRRGSQAAIMAARMTLAADSGCQYVFTETGEAVDNDPQHSYKNILKAGFSESVLRQNWGPVNN